MEQIKQNKPLRVVALISGRGSNLKNLLENATSFSVAAIVSDKPEAAGLAFGKERGIPTISHARSEYPSLSAHKEAIYESVRTFVPDVVVLAGFMQIVAPHFVEEFKGRIINIHPALLPAFPGLHTHERAIAEGSHEHGCTVHVVDAGVDTGSIIAQAAVPVLNSDTPDSLGARVLAREHLLYPWVLNMIGRGDITLASDQVNISPVARLEGVEMGFTFGA